MYGFGCEYIAGVEHAVKVTTPKICDSLPNAVTGTRTTQVGKKIYESVLDYCEFCMLIFPFAEPHHFSDKYRELLSRTSSREYIDYIYIRALSCGVERGPGAMPCYRLRLWPRSRLKGRSKQIVLKFLLICIKIEDEGMKDHHCRLLLSLLASWVCRIDDDDPALKYVSQFYSEFSHKDAYAVLFDRLSRRQPCLLRIFRVANFEPEHRLWMSFEHNKIGSAKKTKWADACIVKMMRSFRIK